MKSVAVYCGSNPGLDVVYADQAIALGQAIAARGMRLVFGGGNVGLMGIIADAVLQKSGEVIGIIPQQLMEWEVAHTGLTELEVVSNMHERKMRMFDLSDGFIAMPGGFGTMDEMFEMLTWRQIGIADKPCAFFNVNEFYSPLVQMMDQMVSQGFLHREQRNDLHVGADIDVMLDWMERYEPVKVDKWLDEKRRTENLR